MTIRLPSDVEREILAEVHRGHFASVDDALAVAWRVFQQQQAIPEEAARAGKKSKRAKPAQPEHKPLTLEQLHQQMLTEGLITQLPDTAADFDDVDDQPIVIEGEPLSETIIRERG